jgi:hypothetical protein
MSRNRRARPRGRVPQRRAFILEGIACFSRRLATNACGNSTSEPTARAGGHPVRARALRLAPRRCST